jgi:hypothetical protein
MREDLEQRMCEVLVELLVVQVLPPAAAAAAFRCARCRRLSPGVKFFY